MHVGPYLRPEQGSNMHKSIMETGIASGEINNVEQLPPIYMKMDMLLPPIGVLVRYIADERSQLKVQYCTHALT